MAEAVRAGPRDLAVVVDVEDQAERASVQAVDDGPLSLPERRPRLTTSTCPTAERGRRVAT